MNTKGSAVVFMIGAVAGGVTALLLAPKSGAEIRGGLKSRAEEIRARRHKHKVDKPESITELERRRQPDAETMARRTGS
jgi:gas vesicle protein